MFRAYSTASRSSADHRDRSLAFGKYWRRNPFVGRCQGEWGSAKNTFLPVLRANGACFDNSLPRSQVRVLGNFEGVRCGVVRHEALIVRMEVEDLRLLAVVAVG